jgi:PadR family transcriptional regulator, regulatory protein PadR
MAATLRQATCRFMSSSPSTSIRARAGQPARRTLPQRLTTAAARRPHLLDSSTLAYYVNHMDRREHPQAALELLILKTLAAGPNHGFGIALHIEETSSALLRVEEGSLYPALHRLDKAGFIDAEWIVTANGRRARMYRLTRPGRKRLKDIEESLT